MASFDDLLSGLRTDGDTAEGEIPDDWLQGRTTYGGLSAALCDAAARRVLGELPPLRSAQFAFVGPLAGAVRLTVGVLRRGRSTAFVAVDGAGSEGAAVRALLVYGVSRTSVLAFDAVPMPSVAAPEACPPFLGEGAPRFTRHFLARAAGGSPMLAGADDPTFLVWARHESPPRGGAVPAVLALGDLTPPPALALRREFAPVSTITWAVDLPFGDPTDADVAGWTLLRSAAETIHDGYETQAMTLWSADGRPLIIARQLVAIFA